MKLNLNIGDIYAILTAISWSTGVIFFDVAGRKLNSIQMSLLKNIVGVFGFILFLIIKGDSFFLFSNDEFIVLVISGVIGVGLGDIFFLACLRRLGSSLTAIISTSYSFIIFILAYLMYSETISLLSYFGGVLVITGVIIGTLDKSIKKESRDIYMGILFGVLAQLFTAYSVLLLRPIMDSHPVVPIALVRFSTGIFFSLSAIIYLDGVHILKQTITKGFSNLSMITGAFFGTFLSVIFWLSGFKYTLAGRAAIYNQLSTIFIILLAAIFLKEVMTKRKWFSVFLAMSGAIIVSVS